MTTRCRFVSTFFYDGFVEIYYETHVVITATVLRTLHSRSISELIVIYKGHFGVGLEILRSVQLSGSENGSCEVIGYVFESEWLTAMEGGHVSRREWELSSE